ncbi:MAG: sigma-70 family RNA polymerase sigma factor [Cyanobacteriota bacterium]|nr:sigma-70 family RNA polymerase sigma factor [Cyanobacteriota bacterium]
MSDVFGDYLRSIGRIPMLTPAEELHLAAVVQAWLNHPHPDKGLERRGRRAMDRMVTANLRLVISACRPHQQRIQPHQSLDPIDLVQAGNLGLIRAVERFDPSRGYRFSTYAYWWIRQAVIRHIQDHGSAIRVPPQVAELARKVGALQGGSRGRRPLSALAAELGESEQRLGFVLRTMENTRALSLDQRLGDGDGDGSLVDRVGDERLPDEPQSWEWLHREVERLSGLERQILELRYASDPGLTLKMASERVGIPRDRLKRIERRALDKLRRRVDPMLHPA